MRCIHQHLLKQLTLLLALLLTSTLSVLAQVQIDRTYRIVPVGRSQLSLFVKDARLSAGADVVLWSETNVPAQQWTIGHSGTNGFTIRNAYSGLYLGLKDNTHGDTVLTVDSAASGQWCLETVDEAALIYRMRPMSGSNYLGAASTAAGTLTSLADSTEQVDEQWQFIEVEEPVTMFNAAVRYQMIDSYIARFAKSKGAGFTTFNNGGWGESEQLEVILDAYETTGKAGYLTLAKEMFNWFYNCVGDTWTGGSNGSYNWFGYDFNDDVMWQIIAVARLGLLTGETKYRTLAKRNFDLIYKRAYMPEYGMMRWAESSGDRTSSNSCIMGPSEVAACYLAMLGCGEEYYEKARDLYSKQRQYLFNPSSGQVFDCRVWSTGSMNHWASTYNQGTMLGAAVMLYGHYGTALYRTDAEAIARYCRSNMCDANGIILVCQVNDGDLCGFKGILMRYVRRFAAELGHPEYNEWIQKNALHAYNNRTPEGVTTSAWLKKSTTETSTNAFSCSTAASAAANVVLED